MGTIFEGGPLRDPLRGPPQRSQNPFKLRRCCVTLAQNLALPALAIFADILTEYFPEAFSLTICAIFTKTESRKALEVKRLFSEQLSEFQGILGATLGLHSRPKPCDNKFSEQFSEWLLELLGSQYQKKWSISAQTLGV